MSSLMLAFDIVMSEEFCTICPFPPLVWGAWSPQGWGQQLSPGGDSTNRVGGRGPRSLIHAT